MVGHINTIAFDCHSVGNGYESPGEIEFNAMMSDQVLGHPRPTPSRPMTARTISARVVPKLLPGSSQPNLSSLDMMVEEAKRAAPRRIGLRDRVASYQWTWFTMTMATGGVANLLRAIPYQSDWLQGFGLFFYFFNLVLFILNCILITIRFRLQPGSFVNSFTDQVESLFIPSFTVSIATILISTCEYGIKNAGPWLQSTLEAGFWIYVAVAVLSSAFMYLVLWSTQVFPIHTMTPVWVFPAYPLLLTAPYAASLIAQSNTNINSMSIALMATVVQGTGFLISFMIIASFLYRLMTQKLPRDTQRPGIFISIGPSGFTVTGIAFLILRRERSVGPHLHLGVQANEILPEKFLGADRELAATIIKFIAVIVGLWLWGLSVWFFFVSVGSLFKYLRPERRLPFLMTWWSFVFPNTALVTATEQLGNVFDSTLLQVIGCVLAGSIILVWVIIFCTMIRAILRKKLLYPMQAQH